MDHSFSSHSLPPSTLARPRISHQRGVPRRRTGQALLLAVLLMVFVALLAATFVTVVALNLNQTARVEDKSRARQATQAGINYVNDQLTNSPDGAKWFQNEVKRTAGVPTYYPGAGPYPTSGSTYYNDYERANGWAGRFLKFPDPRRPVADNSPTFLARVDTVQSSDPDNTDGTKTGKTRITVIGLSQDDPAAFDRSVAYKGAPSQNPFGGYMWSKANNALAGKGQVPAGLVASSTPPTVSAVTLSPVKGQFPEAPFYINIGKVNPTASDPPLRTTVVQTKTVNADGSVTLAFVTPFLTTPIDNTPVVGERVELAAAIGAPTQINDVTNGPTQAVSFAVSRGNAPGSMLVNGGLALFGNTLANALLSPDLATASSKAAGRIEASGMIALNADGTNNKTVTGQFTDGGSTDNVTDAPMVDSSSALFPLSAKDNSSTLLTADERQHLDAIISDGYNRIANRGSATTRQTKAFMPPDITQGTDGVSRYRTLSKFSLPANSSDPADAALYGYGEGIYVDNTDDVEKVTSGGQLQPMVQKQFVSMWSSPESTPVANYQRAGVPVPMSTPAASLEERHLRGWVGPNEFRARGALIELDPTARKVYITRDARADATPNGPDASKGWRDANGALLGDSTLGGVYREAFSWPTNGVIFCEGNARVRGGVPDPDTSSVDPRNSVTIVSMGNIYVEGSLNAGGKSAGRKVLLLAAKNVVCNPTALVQHVDEQTLLATSASTATITVRDASAFENGDWIQIGTSVADSACIIGISSDGNPTTNDTLTLNRAVTGAVNDVVRTQTDPLNPGSTLTDATDDVPYTGVYDKLYGFNQVLQRRFQLPNTTATTTALANNNLRLDMRHSGWRLNALQVEARPATDGSTSPTYANLSVSRPTPAPVGTPLPSYVDGTTRSILVESDLASSPDIFPTPYPSPSPTPFSVANLKANIDATRPEPGGSDPWGYKTTLDVTTIPGTTPPASVSFDNTPFHALTAIGTHRDFTGTDSADYITADPAKWKHNILSAPYDIPLATSVTATMNGAGGLVQAGSYTVPLATDEYSTTAGTFSPLAFGMLGFNPDPVGSQDTLTSDQSFYTRTNAAYGGITGGTYDKDVFYTLDSRVLGGMQVGDNTVALRLNDDALHFYDQVIGGIPTAIPPFYHLSRLKLEDITFSGGSSGSYTGLQPAQTMDIRAYVYAQQGSWFVIPGGYYDDTIRYDSTTTPASFYVDYNNNGARDLGEDLDLNRDGVIDPMEAATPYRFHRYNYKVAFTGSILDNQSPVVVDIKDPATPTTTLLYGAVQSWTDKWATLRLDGSNTPVNISADDPGKDTMSYTFDDAFARDTNGNYLNDAGFQYPVSPDLVYQD